MCCRTPSKSRKEVSEPMKKLCTTATGRNINVTNLRLEDIDIQDIAHSLSMRCRWGGFCKEFFSIAEHTVHVVDIVEMWGADRNTQKRACLHDAAEAYLGDMATLLKRLDEMAAFRELEDRVQSLIFERFGVQPTPSSAEAVKRADRVMLAVEGKRLMPASELIDLSAIADDPHPHATRGLACYAPSKAKQRFLETFRGLFERE